MRGFSAKLIPKFTSKKDKSIQKGFVLVSFGLHQLNVLILNTWTCSGNQVTKN